MMTAEGVLIVLDRLRDLGVVTYISGGWGVDGVFGKQTRPHADLDIAIDSAGEADVIEALERLGYSADPEMDWRPVRLVMRDKLGREVDVHPVQFDEGGNGMQANFEGLPPFHYPARQLATGQIDGQTVPCISPSLQMEFHRGYEPRERDQHDLRLLHQLLRAR